MYRSDRAGRVIRYNPWVFARDLDHHLGVTVPHEAAHYIVDLLHGLRRTRPHGREWKAIMHLLGAPARARGDYDLQGVPLRRQRRYEYRCGCRRHQLSGMRHRRAQARERRYLCLHCRGELRYTGANRLQAAVP